MRVDDRIGRCDSRSHAIRAPPLAIAINVHQNDDQVATGHVRRVFHHRASLQDAQGVALARALAEAIV